MEACLLQYFFHHRNNLDINVVIKEAYHFMEATPPDIHPQRVLDDFIPLTKGQYPVFNKYPKFIVDYQSQEWERIRQDEIEYLRERYLMGKLKTVSNWEGQVDTIPFFCYVVYAWE